MSQKTRRTVGSLIVLAVGVLLAIRLWPDLGKPSSAEAEPDAEPILRVATHVVTPEVLVERFATTGTIRANEQVEVVSEISGKVVEIFFEEGSGVREGQMLVQIDDAGLQAERERIVHRLDLAERRENRQQELFEDGFLSQEEFDSAQSQANVLRSELRIVDVEIEKTQIRAPFRGTVGLRFVSLGSYVTSQTRIASLQDVESVKIDFSVPERYSQKVRVGSEIQFLIAGSAEPFSGTIYAAEPSVDPETRSLALRARCPNPNGLLVPGSFANVEIAVREVEDALAVPSIAVIPELGGEKVFVVEDGRAAPRSVTTGLRSADQVEITFGLEPGDRVITSGIQLLRAGSAVESEAAP